MGEENITISPLGGEAQWASTYPLLAPEAPPRGTIHIFAHQCPQVCIIFQNGLIFVRKYPMYFGTSILFENT